MVEDSFLGKVYKDGDIIFKENSIGKVMYIIMSGMVSIIKEKGGVETVLSTLKEGDFFGEMALFDNCPRSATVKAVGNVHALEIDKKSFFKKVSRDPSLAFRILEKMSQRIREADDRVLKHIAAIKNIITDPKEFY